MTGCVDCFIAYSDKEIVRGIVRGKYNGAKHITEAWDILWIW